MTTSRTAELREIAQAIADAMPPAVWEAVLTGSLSRGVADELSDWRGSRTPRSSGAGSTPPAS